MRSAIVSITSQILVVALGLILAPNLGWADDTSNKDAAQDLLDEAMRLLDSGDVAAACKKMEDAETIYAGVGIREQLGECYERGNRLASAWTKFRSALSLAHAKGDLRRIEALQGKVEALTPRLSFVRIDVPESSRVDGMKIVWDGTLWTEAQWWVLTPTDAGAHSLEVTAPGKQSWRRTVVIQREQEKIVITVPPLEGAETEKRSVSQKQTIAIVKEPITVSANPPRDRAEPRNNSEAWSTWQIVGVSSGAAGVVGLGVGGYFGVKALSLKADSEGASTCNSSSKECINYRKGLKNDSLTAANASTVFIASGSVLLVGGIALYWLTPSSKNAANLRVNPQVSAKESMLSLEGSW